MTNNKEGKMTTTQWDILWEKMSELEKLPWVEQATDYLLRMGRIPMVDSIWDTDKYFTVIDEKAQDLWERQID